MHKKQKCLSLSLQEIKSSSQEMNVVCGMLAPLAPFSPFSKKQEIDSSSREVKSRIEKIHMHESPGMFSRKNVETPGHKKTQNRQVK